MIQIKHRLMFTHKKNERMKVKVTHKWNPNYLLYTLTEYIIKSNKNYLIFLKDSITQSFLLTKIEFKIFKYVFKKEEERINHLIISKLRFIQNKNINGTDLKIKKKPKMNQDTHSVNVKLRV